MNPNPHYLLVGVLTLIGLRELKIEGSQIVLATHSPILAAWSEAQLYEIGEWGLRESSYEELEVVRSWSMFLNAPQRYLRLLCSPSLESHHNRILLI